MLGWGAEENVEVPSSCGTSFQITDKFPLPRRSTYQEPRRAGALVNGSNEWIHRGTFPPLASVNEARKAAAAAVAAAAVRSETFASVFFFFFFLHTFRNPVRWDTSAGQSVTREEVRRGSTVKRRRYWLRARGRRPPAGQSHSWAPFEGRSLKNVAQRARGDRLTLESAAVSSAFY